MNRGVTAKNRYLSIQVTMVNRCLTSTNIPDTCMCAKSRLFSLISLLAFKDLLYILINFFCDCFYRNLNSRMLNWRQKMQKLELRKMQSWMNWKWSLGMRKKNSSILWIITNKWYYIWYHHLSIIFWIFGKVDQ